MYILETLKYKCSLGKNNLQSEDVFKCKDAQTESSLLWMNYVSKTTFPTAARCRRGLPPESTLTQIPQTRVATIVKLNCNCASKGMTPDYPADRWLGHIDVISNFSLRF